MTISDSQVVLYNQRELPLLVTTPLFLPILFDVCLVFGPIPGLVVRVILPPLPPAFETRLPVIGVSGGPVAMVVAPATTLTCRRGADGLFGMKRGRIE